MTAIDIVFLTFVVFSGLVGYTRGFLRSLVGIAGFAAGALLGSIISSHLFPATLFNSHTTASLTGFLVGGFVGFALTGLFSRVIRKVLLPFTILRVLDSILGTALMVTLALGFVWVVSDLASTIGGPGISQTLADSRIIKFLNDYAPESALSLGQQLSDNLARNPIPQVFRTLVTGVAPAVPTPSSTAIPVGATAALGSVVRVEGTAPSCKADITGSGFVVGPGRVVTNAHVVAGVENPHIRVGGHGPDYTAIVVGIDRKLDVAVLDVVGLNTTPLAFGPSATQGALGAFAGFPGGRGLVALPATIGPTTELSGIDIDGLSSTPRQVIVFAGDVQHGDSGGPLLDKTGHVIGMVFASDPTKSEVGFALRPIDIVPLVLKSASSIAPVDTGKCAAGVSAK